MNSLTTNKSPVKSLIFIVWICLFTKDSLGTPVIPAGRQEFDFIYDRIERLQTLQGGLFDYQIGPYALMGKEFDIAPLHYLNSDTPDRLTYFGIGNENYSAAKNSPSAGLESLRGGLVAHPFEKLYMYGNFVLDESRANDSNYTGKKWRGLAGDVEQAFAYYSTDRFNLTLGRFASFWGPRNSLVLGPNVSLDGIGYTINWGRLSLTYRLARLDGLNPDEDSVLQFENRFFAGHRLDIHFNSRLRAGFFETVVFGGPGRQIELYYLNPILFFHGSQLNDGADDNTFVGFDFDYIPTDRIRIFGQLLIDDIQIEKKTQGDQEPDEIGVLLGAHWVNVTDKTDLKTVYTRVSNRTYNQGQERNRYIHDGKLLSNTMGNDFDQWELSVTRWLDDNLKVGINFSHTRKGEGKVTDTWTTSWLNVTGKYSEPFPTGVVEKTMRIGLSASGFFGKYLFGEIEGGVEDVKNFENLAANNKTLQFINLRLTTFFSGSIKVE